MGQILNGRKIAKAIRRDLAQHITTQEIDAGLAVILVGDDPASQTYVKLKEHAANQVGIRVQTDVFPANTSTQTLLARIQELNVDPRIHGILVQLPLPAQVDTPAIIASIHPLKDADGFQATSPLTPVMAQVVEVLLQETGEPLHGKTAFIIANTPDVFAPPIAAQLAPHGILCASAAPDDAGVAEELGTCAIIISAVGRPHWIEVGAIQEDAILIDIGITKVGDEIFGDIHPGCDEKAAWRTRVPGGVGPVTVALLLKNVVTCYQLQKDAS